jgi:hypothetical protein
MEEPVWRARSSRDIALATEWISIRSDFRRIGGSRAVGERVVDGSTGHDGRRAGSSGRTVVDGAADGP